MSDPTLAALRKIVDAKRHLFAHLIASAHLLDTPFVNAPDQTPWSRMKRAMEGLNEAITALDTVEQTGRWELPPEPGPEVTELWDRDGKRHQRHPDFPDTWVNEFGWLRGWSTLVAERGPLSAAPPETAGGGQDG